MFGSQRYSDNPINWSFSVGRLFGIRIRIHLFFILIVLVLVARNAPSFGLLGALGMVGILFGVVLLHEFGHCFGARAIGGEADEILMWPLGGLAYTRPPETPAAHLITTIAGPLVNVLICGACATFLWLNHSAQSFAVVPWNPFNIYASFMPENAIQMWVSYTFSISYIILLFNLVPMYPLDGGRIVQSVLWGRLGFRRANSIACITGMIGAIGLGLVGLISEEVMLLAIAMFGYLTCWQQKQMLRYSEGLDESEFGYDFSQGYTSLERSLRQQTQTRRPTLIQRWRLARAERRRRREQQRKQAEEAMLDQLLDKVHREGLHSLTSSERRMLDDLSSKRR